jgi:hypothetical protein
MEGDQRVDGSEDESEVSITKRIIITIVDEMADHITDKLETLTETGSMDWTICADRQVDRKFHVLLLNELKKRHPHHTVELIEPSRETCMPIPFVYTNKYRYKFTALIETII